MGMRKLNGHHKAILWDDVKNEESGIKGSVQASVSFDVVRPQCSRCTNKNRRVVVLIEHKKGSAASNLRLCTDCLRDLVEGINESLKQFCLVRLVLSGMPIDDAIEEVLQGNITDAEGASSLQASLDYMVDMMYAATGQTEAKKQKKAEDVEKAFDNIIDEIGEQEL